jgi:hypothetical protein
MDVFLIKLNSKRSRLEKLEAKVKKAKENGNFKISTQLRTYFIKETGHLDL